MPLREIERRVLKLLAANRSPDSFVAGATVIHRAPDSPRYSRDVDLFHDTAESVARCAQMDIDVLRAHGYEVNWLLNQPTFQRADVGFERERFRLEWAFDSAFRFFPIEPDEELGYRLNFWDAATNKVLALASRSEVRDLVDALYLDANHLALGALAWAAAGKDQGLNPLFILEEAKRTTHYTQAELDSLDLAKPLSLIELKPQWLTAVARAEKLIRRLPAEEVGCLYLDGCGRPITPDADSPQFSTWRRHFGSVRGAWPQTK